MKLLNRIFKFAGDERGVTFLEVMTTFTMISVAVVCTTYSLFFAHSTLREDMHRQQVVRMVQQEVEYWVGRLYMGGQDLPNPQEWMGSGNAPYRTPTLDPEALEPITVRLFYDPIVGRGSYQGSSQGAPTPAYYVITVWAEWKEPGSEGKTFSRANGNAVSLTTYVVPGGISG